MPDALLLLIGFCLGYLFGSVPYGLLLTRMAGLGDIRAIVAIAVLDEDLGPHELGRRDDLHRRVVDADVPVGAARARPAHTSAAISATMRVSS